MKTKKYFWTIVVSLKTKIGGNILKVNMEKIYYKLDSLDKEKQDYILNKFHVLNEKQKNSSFDKYKSEHTQIDLFDNNMYLNEEYQDMNLSDIYKLCGLVGLSPQSIIEDDDAKFDPTFFENNADFIDYSQYKPSNSNKPKVLELFAGAGGLLLGLEKAGFETVGAIELDKDAANTLRTNRPDLNVIEGDIADIVTNGLENYINTNVEIDLISGGAPCQTYSYAGRKLGLDDTRGTLFYWYAKAIEELQPKMFLFENVRGLISHEKGKTLQGIIEVFESVGYNVTYRLLNANNYGVAQKRQRVIIVGVREDLDYKLFQYPAPLDYKPVLRDALIDVPLSKGKIYPQRKKEIMDMVPPGGYWRDLPIEVQKEYMKASFYLGGGKTGMARRISWDEPSLTLTTSPDMKQTERCHPDETRPFTVREYARIQSFPDEWIFEGSLTSQYKQIGNAVPVELGKYIGYALNDYLSKIPMRQENA